MSSGERRLALSILQFQFLKRIKKQILDYRPMAAPIEDPRRIIPGMI